ncbi:MAG: DHH family phosphoesterase [Solirubrobacteraceae bacterium]
MTENGNRSSRARILEKIRGASKLVAVSHENPDGDALGSLVAMQQILVALGKDSVIYIDAEEFPLPHEYRFLPLNGVVNSLPRDIDERTITFLDCGNLDRASGEALQRPRAHMLNIDHHHDNTRFGTVNLVDPQASCTAEIVWDLMHGLGITPTVAIAEALYVGLITDTGRFMYENTGPRAHLMAAELIEAGVDVHEMYRRLYEGVPYGKLALLSRGLAKIERYDDGRLTLTGLTVADFTESGAAESYSEGVVDHLRAVEGTALAALVRDRIGQNNGEGMRKVSLRASDERVDVSRIARAQGGGGHRGAAGFTTALSWAELVSFLRNELAQQLL